MQIQRCGPVDAEIPVVLDDSGAAYDLRSLTDDITGAFLAADGMGIIKRALAAGDLPAIDVSEMRIGAPIARPMAVVCIGMNYTAHAAETGSAPPPNPIVFFKHPNTVVGPNDDLRLPPQSASTDWEVELGVVIAKQVRYLPSAKDALQYVAGYVLSNDVSEREYQIEISGNQWSKGKCCETFNPLGPSLVPVDDVPDVQALRLQSWVNGEVRQDSSTADMIFGVAQLIYELSQFMTLEPGDLINTGTPQGVALSGNYPYLAAGDQMRINIGGLGTQTQQVIAAPDVPAGAGAHQVKR